MGNKKYIKYRYRLYISLLLLVSLLAGTGWYIAVDKGVAYYYQTPDGNIELKKYGGEYFINNEKLEHIDKPYPWLERIGRIAFLFGLCIVVSIAIVFLLRGIPPIYRWRELLGLRRKSDIIPTLSLPNAPGGIIGLRYWHIKSKNKESFLRSTVQKEYWDRNIKDADEKPKIGGWKGIYSYRLGSYHEKSYAVVAGIVCLTGKIVSHGDNILRAESCQILLLITKKKDGVEWLKEKYKCPVYLTTDINRTIDTWVLSKEGLFWLNHNTELIDKKIRLKMESDIKNLLPGELS